MPLMLDDMRAEFARFLSEDPAGRFRMDAALVRVVTVAYNNGLTEQVAALTKEKDIHQRSCEALVICNKELNDQLDALTVDRDRWKSDYLEQVEKHNLTLDELAAAQATNERLREALDDCHYIDVDGEVHFNYGPIRFALALPNDTEAFDARLKAAYKRGYEDGVHCNE